MQNAKKPSNKEGMAISLLTRVVETIKGLLYKKSEIYYPSIFKIDLTEVEHKSIIMLWHGGQNFFHDGQSTIFAIISALCLLRNSF